MDTPVEAQEFPQNAAPLAAGSGETAQALPLVPRRRASSDAAVAHQQLFLSVMLLLIAFFALLVSRSEVEQTRAEKVLQSIEGTFNPSFSLPSILDRMARRPGSDSPAIETDDRSDLRRSLALRLATEEIDAEAFRILFEPDELFEEPRPILRTDRLLMLGRLAQSLADRRPGSAERATLLLEGPMGDLAPGDRENVQERLDILRARLRELGAPENRIEVGLREGGQYRWVFEVDSKGPGA
ncbi:MAG: hypothetical protein R3C97_12015 [Geminicoccaceae bacterium]